MDLISGCQLKFKKKVWFGWDVMQALQRGDPEQASPLIGRRLTAAEGSKTTSRRLLLLKEQDLHSKRQRRVVDDLMSLKIPAVSGGS
ncbi:hypothetical protein J1N35_034111 [Gossypium stocksii]|uniref:Uncharacterized protein n=1 Tax=Gossypium stocksii TaxID=47602 RepID=A0A9D3ZNZ6_9ROSI|nr:hypothetical protein J1N35_034111 [Gossypium stocksii]